jgi:RNA polymerase sigma factor (TIGR02999 family)
MATPDVTELLLAWGRGEESALEKLMPVVYQELRRMARRHMRGERADHTLQATALVNEAYLRLVDSSQVRWQNRAHFLAVASQLMRRVLVDAARTRHHQKHSGSRERVTLDECLIVSAEPGPDLVALDDALEALAVEDSRKARVVECRFFGGLSLEETAEVLKVSTDTVLRDWKVAKMWLLREMRKQLGSRKVTSK